MNKGAMRWLSRLEEQGGKSKLLAIEGLFLRVNLLALAIPVLL